MEGTVRLAPLSARQGSFPEKVFRRTRRYSCEVPGTRSQLTTITATINRLAPFTTIQSVDRDGCTETQVGSRAGQWPASQTQKCRQYSRSSGVFYFEVPHRQTGQSCPDLLFGLSSEVLTKLKKAQATGRKVPTPEETATLKLKKAWEIALAPAKQLPMQAIMGYMSGNSLQIFSIMMVFML